MDIFLYIIIFIMGTLFGSFYTLAIYRIPNKIDITHTHSFCPNCHHKLGFFELIPVWSYIFLGGKCKECKQKIRPRYLIIEVLSGIVLVLIAKGFNISYSNLQINTLIELGFLIMYLSGIVIIAGIDLEKRKIEKSVIYYALGILVLYIIYLCIVDKANIYRYIMYLSITLVLLIIDTLILKKKANTSYTLSILILLLIMVVFTGEAVAILTVIMTLLIIVLYILFNKLRSYKSKIKVDKKGFLKQLNLGFYLTISNIIMFIYVLYIYL